MPPLKNTVTGVNEIAVEGINPAGGRGVQGVSGPGFGVTGISATSAGVRGDSTSGRGTEGWSDTGEGILGLSKQGIGVSGEAMASGPGGRGGIGVFGKGPVAAGHFEGHVTITRNLKVQHIDASGIAVGGSSVSYALSNIEGHMTVAEQRIKELQDAVTTLYKLTGHTPPKFT